MRVGFQFPMSTHAYTRVRCKLKGIADQSLSRGISSFDQQRVKLLRHFASERFLYCPSSRASKCNHNSQRRMCVTETSVTETLRDIHREIRTDGDQLMQMDRSRLFRAIYLVFHASFMRLARRAIKPRFRAINPRAAASNRV